jgi:hypothetical protein
MPITRLITFSTLIDLKNTEYSLVFSDLAMNINEMILMKIRGLSALPLAGTHL